MGDNSGLEIVLTHLIIGDMTQYRMCSDETILMTEIYLPKKVRYQGIVYETLKECLGFISIDDIIQKMSISKDKRIALLSRHYPELSDHYEARLDKFNFVFGSYTDLFSGFSMYEVDGVFRSEDGKRVYEERTQIIRIFFRPRFENLATKFDVEEDFFERLYKIYFRSEVHDYEFVISKNSLTEKETSVIRFIDEWIECIGIFLFGFVMYEITQKIIELCKNQIHDPEEEIWLTTGWGVGVNIFKHVNHN